MGGVNKLGSKGDVIVYLNAENGVIISFGFPRCYGTMVTVIQYTCSRSHVVKCSFSCGLIAIIETSKTLMSQLRSQGYKGHSLLEDEILLLFFCNVY